MLVIRKFSFSSSRFSRALTGFLCALLLAVIVPAATAQTAPVKRATITQVLDSAEVFIQNRQAKVNDSANKGQTVRTERARAQLLFNTGAIGRLAHNSVLTVGQCAQLQQGTLLVNGAMNGCTASVVAGVRGTTYILEVEKSGVTEVKVLEGEVTVQRVRNEEIDSTSSSLTQLLLRSGETVTVSPNGTIGLIKKLTQPAFTELLNGSLFDGYRDPLPGIRKIRHSFQSLFPGIPFPAPRSPTLKIPFPF